VAELQPSQTPGFAPESLLGSTIDGRYRLTAHLATGGMGAVFRAEHVYMRKEVALKVLRPDLTASIDIVERFRREAEIAASLEHDNIVRVTDFGRSPEGYLFLVMELLEGESLFDKLRRTGPMGVDETVRILVQICAGLEAAHRRGVVHRDLKPENIFLHALAGGTPVAKILDFGIAKITDPSTRSGTQSGMVVGTPEYLSPEQALGSSVDPRADLYAVGLIGWRMLAGRHPFRAEEPRALLMMQATQPVPPLTEPRPDLAAWPGLVAAVARACAKGAGERHRSAADLRSELETCLARSGEGGGPDPMLELLPPAGSSAAGPTPGLGSPTPFLRPSLRQAISIRLVRFRIALRRAADSLRSVPGKLAVAWADDRRVRRAIAAIAVALALLAGSLGLRAFVGGRPIARAEALLARGDAAAARTVLDGALRRRPDDPILRALLGRALHRLPGETAAGIQAYETALEKDPHALGPEALADLAGDLAGERRHADRASRLLARAGAPAVPAILAASRQGAGAARLRALTVARDLGAEDKLDRVAAYAALLSDGDCEVRKAAARRLGELGDRAAVPRLREAARATQEIRGFLGIAKSVPGCGAGEAAAAAKRIEASVPSP
jgi:eukaryotic-like serine/threonine-protein kinase